MHVLKNQLNWCPNVWDGSPNILCDILVDYIEY